MNEGTKIGVMRFQKNVDVVEGLQKHFARGLGAILFHYTINI